MNAPYILKFGIFPTTENNALEFGYSLGELFVIVRKVVISMQIAIICMLNTPR